MRYQFTQNGRQPRTDRTRGSTNDLGEFAFTASARALRQRDAARLFDERNHDRSDRYAATYYPGTGNVAEAQRVTVEPGQTVTSINMGTAADSHCARISGSVINEQGDQSPR